MSINLHIDYEHSLKNAEPTFLGEHRVRPPKGALGALTIIPPQLIPPVNTNIQFDVLPMFKLSEHPGLSALDEEKIPFEFNWRMDGKEKSSIISKPGNQMLCGSCWCVSACGIIADNYVVAGIVNWNPNLSTTWCLACYPQLQCKGGNPAKLYQDIANGGIVTNNCVDYSWCAENDACNGKATQHFKQEHAQVNLSALIPNCGCYDSNSKHYLYYIEQPKFVSIGQGGLDENNFAITLKKHIYHNGPVQGGFLVFANFMHGAFTKVNGGVYLENGVYDDGNIHFDENQIKDVTNYKGSHAIAIIGWGTQKGVVVDNNGTKKDVPYWYCRNSWTEKWGDGGYFKMAMYPFNKTVQFDKIVVINNPSGQSVQGGGMVMMNASKPPELKTLPQIQKQFLDFKRSNPKSYYSSETKNKSNKYFGADKSSSSFNYILYIILFLIILFFIIFGFFYYQKNKKLSVKFSNY